MRLACHFCRCSMPVVHMLRTHGLPLGSRSCWQTGGQRCQVAGLVQCLRICLALNCRWLRPTRCYLGHTSHIAWLVALNGSTTGAPESNRAPVFAVSIRSRGFLVVQTARGRRWRGPRAAHCSRTRGSHLGPAAQTARYPCTYSWLLGLMACATARPERPPQYRRGPCPLPTWLPSTPPTTAPRTAPVPVVWFWLRPVGPQCWKRGHILCPLVAGIGRSRLVPTGIAAGILAGGGWWPQAASEAARTTVPTRARGRWNCMFNLRSCRDYALAKESRRIPAQCPCADLNNAR